MSRRRRQTMKESFFGNLISSQLMPADHLLIQSDKTINRHPFTSMLIESYKQPSGGEVRPLNARLAAAALLGMLSESVASYLLEIAVASTKDSAIDQAVDLFFDGVAQRDEKPGGRDI